MGVALTQFVGPENRRLIEERSVAAGVWRLGQSLRQMGHLAGIPGIDLCQFFLRVCIGVGFVREIVLALIDAEPLHVRLPNGVGVLEAGNARKISGQRGDDELNLHPTDLRHLIVLVDNTRFEQRYGVGQRQMVCGKILFELAHKRCVFLQNTSVLSRQCRRHFCEILTNIIQHARQAFAIFDLPVELVKHLVGIVNRSDGLVGACVDHASPRIGFIGHKHSKLKRSKTSCRFGL